MSALSILYLILPFPLAFILHDAEEIIFQHRWMLRHKDSLNLRFPGLRPLTEHLSGLGTLAFSIAALEELVIIATAVCYVLVHGQWCLQVWSALFLAFSIHLLVHIAQAAVIRGYVPGLVTSLLLLPYAFFGIRSISFVMRPWEILLLGGAGVIAMAANLAFAHWLGRKFQSWMKPAE